MCDNYDIHCDSFGKKLAIAILMEEVVLMSSSSTLSAVAPPLCG